MNASTLNNTTVQKTLATCSKSLIVAYMAIIIGCIDSMQDQELHKNLVSALEQSLLYSNRQDGLRLIQQEAEQFAKQYHNNAINPLIEALLSYYPKRDTRTIFITYALVSIADPKNEYELVEKIPSLSSMPIGGAIAAISLLPREQAQTALLRLATGEYSAWPATAPIVYACGYLRSHDPESVRSILKASINRSLLNEKKQYRGSSQKEDVERLISFYDYLLRLKTSKEKMACKDFHRRMWWALSLTRTDNRSSYLPYRLAAHSFSETWKKGDTRFLKDLLESDWSSSHEKRIALNIVEIMNLTELKPIAEQAIRQE